VDIQLSLLLKHNASVDWACEKIREIMTEIRGEGNYGFYINSNKTGSVYFNSANPNEVNDVVSRLNLISPLIRVSRA
jgi:hypothetical protein